MKNDSRTHLDDTLNGTLVAIAVSVTILLNLPWLQGPVDTPEVSAKAAISATVAQAVPTTGLY